MRVRLRDLRPNLLKSSRVAPPMTKTQRRIRDLRGELEDYKWMASITKRESKRIVEIERELNLLEDVERERI